MKHKKKPVIQPQSAKPKKSEQIGREPQVVHRSKAMRASEAHNSLLQGILRSTSDGILAVNQENEVLFASDRFVELWKIPQAIMATKNDSILQEYVLDQLSDPQEFLQKVQDLYHSVEESFDTLYFKDGRAFERVSRPLMQGAEMQGRVWSFRDITERKQAQALREVLLEIMQAGVITKELQDFLGLVHRSIAKVIYAENFFVVLYNKDAAWFEEVYAVDKFDPPGPPSRNKKSISAYIFRTGQPLLLNDEQVFNELVARGEVELVGTNSPSWMGVPLKTSQETIGVMVVQDYDLPNRYTERDMEVLTSIAGQVALVVERKRTEDALAASEAELLALFASMHDVALVIDREGIYRKIAPTNPGLLVKPPEELLGKNLTDVFPAESAEKFLGVVRKVLDTKQTAQIEYFLIIADQTVWFQTTISPMNADSTLWVAHDITNRKRAEEALRESENRIRTLTEGTHAVLTRVNAYGHFTYANDALARAVGFTTPEELIGKSYLHFVHPEDRRRVLESFMDQARTHRPSNQQEFRIVDTAGKIKWFSFLSTLEIEDGRVVGESGVAQEITERKQAEEELRHAKDALETANSELLEALEREKLLACTDGLTGLHNRSYFFKLAAREFHVAMRYQRPLAFLMFDMDDFKQVNDTLGHAAGDRLLELVAQVAVAQVRASDVVARYGGDEFIVLLPNADAQQALPVAERIRAGVSAMGLETLHKGKKPIAVTLSIGVADVCQEPLDENVDRAIQRADEAMYQAKQSGRNRTVIFGQ